MADKQECLTFFGVDRLRPTARKILPPELMSIGEVALRVCRDMKESTAAILRDNRQIMQCNLRIKSTLERDSKRQEKPARKNGRLKGHGNRCYSTPARRRALSTRN